MLLKSSLLLLFIINIVFANITHMSVVFAILFIINIINNQNLITNIKKLKFLFFFYFGTCLFQLFYIQEGEILITFYKYHVTKEGLINLGINFLRIVNIIMISWLVNSNNILKGPLKKYQLVIETVMELVPEVFSLFKKRMKLKWFFRHILKQIKVKN